MIIKKFTKHHKKLKMTYVASAIVLCLLVTILFPYGSYASASDNYDYAITLNGQEIGTVTSKDVFEEALRNARLRINQETGTMIYLEPEIVLQKQDTIFATQQTAKEIEDKIYTLLLESTNLNKKQAYVVDMDGFTVTLGSREDVVALLDAAKNKYDANGDFEVNLSESTSGTYSSITYEIKKTAEAQAAADAQSGSTDGIVGLAFEDNVEIVESYVNDSEISTLDEAISQVTKDKEENKIYEAVAGDCLSTIASDFGLTVAQLVSMNAGLTEDSIIGIGDQVTVTVPEPELSVIVNEQKTYEEDFNAETVYIEDDSMYQGESAVVTEGTQGHRQVTALISYRNGEETNREILNQNVLTEPIAQVEKRGTKVRPTFIKPISGGSLSSTFGPRWGTMHEGVDWACPVGTSVRASCAGTVVSAGWSNGYGYAVVIRHSDGKQTRYGHLSKTLVSAGQYVEQNQQIALSGNTGDSTGPHLHFEIIVNGNQVDPFKYLQ
ncbi:LysM peptidoglycan-binding domain-containing M23 family metallopeptidase [Parasporobacterium paucivorans]|uniref:Murein DD-endopeptidase MepM and murein hydrolase activator NlpD, contain LysM domain n=1 Tax=Parasporobacterium paucivorans DSM 15970 TaxID=1122934 RepID=A0A1M6BDP5_9FIRM|nr:M23 family metallopeptidase [Parasporobacterium paucivorans]SHI46870.1 Murein DD-endopeptidase MepM and murein hydrolase activator NlpD, contain LysM domain [Parasporobacterium paucivorans DSM 15970]